MQDDLLAGPGRSMRARARFFVRIGQVGRATEPRDPYTLPLFPLLLTLETEGLLAEDMKDASTTES